jgi:hypothetical protein
VGPPGRWLRLWAHWAVVMFQCVICANWFPEEEEHRDVIGQTWPWDEECEKLRIAATEIWVGLAEDEAEDARQQLVLKAEDKTSDA